jgi:hypothetical protein
VVPKVLALDLEAVAAVGLNLGEAGVPLISLFDLEAIGLLTFRLT